MKELFKKLITDFHERELPRIIERDIHIPLNTNKIISLTGVRRSGKSFLLFDIIKKLREKFNPQNLIYINFEDDRLFPLKLADLDFILEAYFELYPKKRKEEIYLFIDEVQVVPNWEVYIRRIYDTMNVRIYITGSSSKLLSSELSTALRGRTITYEIFPFSFKELLKAKGIEINFHSSSSLSFIKNALDIYLKHGGFPETINENQEMVRRIISDYLELIVYKDIVERYNIKNRSMLKLLTKYCFSNIATLVSFSKLYNDFKSQGFKISKDTIFQFMQYLEDAYTLFTVPVYRNSIRKEQRNPRKIYTVDNGFKYIYDYSLTGDFGKLYENTIFIHLRRKKKDIYYFKQNQEVDFIVFSHTGPEIINVSYNIDSSSNTKQREIRGLIEAMNYFKVSRAFLITGEHKENISISNKKIEIIPLYEYLINH